MTEPSWQRWFMIGLGLSSTQGCVAPAAWKRHQGRASPHLITKPYLIQFVIRALLGNLSSYPPNGLQSGRILKLVIWEQRFNRTEIQSRLFHLENYHPFKKGKQFKMHIAFCPLHAVSGGRNVRVTISERVLGEVVEGAKLVHLKKTFQVLQLPHPECQEPDRLFNFSCAASV